MVRVRHDKDNPYTCVTNMLVQDDRLNATEKGLMLILLSNADSYILNSTYFIQQTGLGNNRFYNCWNHLIELGYINKRQIQGACEWVINEFPNPLKPDSTLDESTPCEINWDEITPDETKSLISTNETSINETTSKQNNEKKEEENITRDTSTSIFSGIYTGTSILGPELEELVHTINTKHQDAHPKGKVFLFKMLIKIKLEEKIMATGYFKEGVIQVLDSKGLHYFEQRMPKADYESVKPLLQEYLSL